MSIRPKEFISAHLNDIILFIGVILISLLSFAIGYIVARQQAKEPIQIKESANNESFSNLRMDEFVNSHIRDEFAIR